MASQLIAGFTGQTWPLLVAPLYMMYAVYILASSLRRAAAFLYVIGMLIPCVSLLILLILNQDATKTLQSRGIRVGLLGAKDSDITTRS